MKSASGSGISTPDFLSKFDGSGREPRPIQVEALNWTRDHWDKRFLVMQLPVGIGKSFIARTIQRVTQAGIITPTNALLDQYAETYTSLNYLKGKDGKAFELMSLGSDGKEGGEDLAKDIQG